MTQSTSRSILDKIAATVGDAKRLEAVDSYNLLDTAPEPAFQRIVEIIKNAFDIPAAIVSIIDAHRQWYKAADGLKDTEVPLQETFCRFVLADGKPVIVCDATDDLRFATSPHVVGPPGIRFYASAPLTSPEGEIIGTICAIDTRARDFSRRDAALLDEIAALTMDILEMRRTAQTDMLTGALTRRGLVQAGRLALKRSDRNRQDLSCIVFDIDHFKQINDRYGHAAGDRALQDVAEACLSSLREVDHFGRIGGEEFAILLESTKADGALIVAEKIRKEIEAFDFDMDGKTVNLTASFGVSSRKAAQGSLSELLAAADANLYAAKRAGRNKTHSGEEPPEMRHRVLRTGLIRFDSGREQIACTVRSLSKKSAGIDVSDANAIPA